MYSTPHAHRRAYGRRHNHNAPIEQQTIAHAPGAAVSVPRRLTRHNVLRCRQFSAFRDACIGPPRARRRRSTRSGSARGGRGCDGAFGGGRRSAQRRRRNGKSQLLRRRPPTAKFAEMPPLVDVVFRFHLAHMLLSLAFFRRLGGDSLARRCRETNDVSSFSPEQLFRERSPNTDAKETEQSPRTDVPTVSFG